MQKLKFIQRCLNEISSEYPQAELIEGDRYCPLLGVRIRNFELPTTIVEDTVDVLVPMPMCGGYFREAYISGVHVAQRLHVNFEGENSPLPFCIEATERDLVAMKTYYPLYRCIDRVPERYVICLYTETDQPRTPLQAIHLFSRYLAFYLENCRHIAAQRSADPKWLSHLVEGLSPRLKADFLAHAAR